MSDSAYSDSLVSSESLDKKLKQPENLLILDVRPRFSYLLGHIPGAHNVWRPAFQADESDYPFSSMRASKEKMVALLSRLGATSDTEIILYDDQQGMDAARLWWLLKLYGHDQVSILNGGLTVWEDQKRATSLKPPKMPERSKYIFRGTEHPQWLAELSQVKSIKDEKNAILIDVRSFDEYTGKTRKSGAHRRGRIPESLWFEYNQTVNKNGFLDKEQLRQMFLKEGITPEKAITVYCQSGVRSAHTFFVLSEILGYKNIKNYDGSWIEWSWRKELPTVKGSPKKTDKSLN
ncbi:sulfurtransferase [Endozoicomonas arenosclerae]|uniref:sulfurtransferase n=1 Tax=Endozoicomonas arenosclerae TaxID=1633495 RepID=UPI000781C0BA|nr:sulfurtransferase [Endozoicomonas arenosclerae]